MLGAHGHLALKRAADARKRGAPIDTTCEIDTPEQVRFSFRLAGPAQRGVAYLIDLLARAVIIVIGAFVAGMMGMFARGFAGTTAAVTLLLVFLVEWGYYVVSELVMGGRSLGKQALSLRVVRTNGLPIRFSDSALRNLLRAADFLPMLYCVGLIAMAFDKSFRRLGDLAAGTIVVSEQSRTVSAAVDFKPPPKPNELARIPAKPALTADDLDAIEIFLRRYERLSPIRQDELADMVAPLYASRMGLRYRDAARFLALLYYRASKRVSS